MLRLSCASSWFFFTQFHRDARSKNIEHEKFKSATVDLRVITPSHSTASSAFNGCPRAREQADD